MGDRPPKECHGRNVPPCDGKEIVSMSIAERLNRKKNENMTTVWKEAKKPTLPEFVIAFVFLVSETTMSIPGVTRKKAEHRAKIVE